MPASRNNVLVADYLLPASKSVIPSRQSRRPLLRDFRRIALVTTGSKVLILSRPPIMLLSNPDDLSLMHGGLCHFDHRRKHVLQNAPSTRLDLGGISRHRRRDTGSRHCRNDSPGDGAVRPARRRIQQCRFTGTARASRRTDRCCLYAGVRYQCPGALPCHAPRNLGTSRFGRRRDRQQHQRQRYEKSQSGPINSTAPRRLQPSRLRARRQWNMLPLASASMP